MDIYSAISEPNRRRIIEMLAARGQLSASQISDEFKMSAPAISQHLKILREAKLVDMQKHAQQRLYSINPASMLELEDWIHKLAKMWNKRFDALEKVLQAEKRKLKKY